MTGAVTWEQIVFFFGLLGSLFTVLAFVWHRIESARAATRKEIADERNERQAAIDKLRSELAAHQVAAASNYASREMIDQVEERIGSAIGNLRSEIQSLRSDVMKMAQGRR